jgi:hypothetical protein
MAATCTRNSVLGCMNGCAAHDCLLDKSGIPSRRSTFSHRSSARLMPQTTLACQTSVEECHTLPTCLPE